MDVPALVSLLEWPSGHRPVLAATLGPGPRPPAHIAAAILASLGDGATELVLSRRMTKGHADPAHRVLSAALSRGRSVLVHLADRTAHARRVLLDASARHLASAVALVRGPRDTVGGFVARLAGEGWSAAVVLR
jgi:hypothetical protein